jgi:uncharacterized protein
MSFDILSRIYSECFSSRLFGVPVTFLWHAGEPLAVPQNFYRQAFELARTQNHQKRVFDHFIQTNGTLLNPEWIRLIDEYKVGIGVSLDGPEFLHDAVRRTRRGVGTHSKVMRGIRLLEAAEIPFSVITVLTYRSLDYAREMFEFFYSNHIHDVGFNIDEIEGPYKRTSFASTGAIEKYKAFMSEFLALVDGAGGKMKIREFESIFNTALDPNFGDFTDSTNQVLGVVNFDYLGNCSMFSPELLGAESKRFKNFILGNISTESLEDMLATKLFSEITHEIAEGLNRCKESCEYWGFCGGGPPANKFFETGRFDVTETLFCRVHKKALVDTLLSFAEQRIANSR